jgi:hypothetical protein
MITIHQPVKRCKENLLFLIKKWYVPAPGGGAFARIPALYRTAGGGSSQGRKRASSDG